MNLKLSSFETIVGYRIIMIVKIMQKRLLVFVDAIKKSRQLHFVIYTSSRH